MAGRVRKVTAGMAIALLPTLAGAWQADNLHTVNPLPGGVFEVIGEPGSAGPDFWCAAGDYATRVLGVAGTRRIYIVRGRGAPQTSDRKVGVQFALSPASGADPGQSVFLSMRRVGDNLSAVFARNYCLDRRNAEF